MKTRLWIISLCLVLASCKPGDAALELRMIQPVDSFEVRGIDIGPQVQNFNCINDTTLCCFNFQDTQLVLFSRNPNSRIYHVQRKTTIETAFMSSYTIGEDHRFYFISREHGLSIYDSSGTQLLAKKRLQHRFRYLKDSFDLMSSNLSPAIIRGDTIVAALVHNDVDAYMKQFKEDAMVEFLMKGDTARLIRSYLPRPQGLEHQYYPFQLYCYTENTVHLMYPGVDTVYNYNRGTQELTKIPLHNPDYSMPAAWDFGKLGTNDYERYVTKYVQQNFSYDGLRYNPDRKEYLLVYALNNKASTKPSAQRDNKTVILVLDSAFRPLRKVYLPPQVPYVIVKSFFYIPGKGFAVPVLKDMTVMKIRLSIFILFSLCMAQPSCTGQEGVYEQQFRSYLNKTFSLRPKEGVIYCFLPANQCRYCIHYDGKWLPSALRDRFVILSGFPESDYPNFPEVHYDWKDEMLFLDFLDYGNRFVIYKDQHIQSIWITDFYKQLDSLALHS